MRVKYLAQEHNTMSPARTRTRTTRSGVEHTDHEATAPPKTTNSWIVKSVFPPRSEIFLCPWVLHKKVVPDAVDHQRFLIPSSHGFTWVCAVFTYTLLRTEPACYFSVERNDVRFVSVSVMFGCPFEYKRASIPKINYQTEFFRYFFASCDLLTLRRANPPTEKNCHKPFHHDV